MSTTVSVMEDFFLIFSQSDLTELIYDRTHLIEILVMSAGVDQNKIFSPLNSKRLFPTATQTDTHTHRRDVINSSEWVALLGLC